MFFKILLASHEFSYYSIIRFLSGAGVFCAPSYKYLGGQTLA